jgi:uncharacterized protein YjbJ (UPF0337 family)
VPIDFGFEGPATIDFGFEGPAEQPKKKQPDWRDTEAASNLEAMQGPKPRDPGDMEVRGNILPISRNVETGRRSAAIPGFIQDPLMLPGDVYTGKTDPNSDEGIQRALGFAGGVTLASKFGGAPKQAPISQSKGMPRASVRDEGELLKTGGARIEEAKLNPAKVDADLLATPMQAFRDATKTQVIENKTVNNIAKRLEKAYTPRKPDEMSRLTKVQPPERPPVTLTELHAHQQRLDDVINGPGKSQDGRLNSEGRAAIELKKAVGSMIDNHPESTSFKIGKHEYHRGKMSESMADLKKRAEGRVQWRNGDEAGALQSEIQNFLRNKRNRYALTPEVRRKLDQLSRDSRGKVIGAFSPQSSFGGNVFARGIETAIGFPGALAVPGHFARQGRNSRLIKEFENLMEELRAGGPVR